jgi:hypothetical protein
MGRAQSSRGCKWFGRFLALTNGTASQIQTYKISAEVYDVRAVDTVYTLLVKAQTCAASLFVLLKTLNYRGRAADMINALYPTPKCPKPNAHFMFYLTSFYYKKPFAPKPSSHQAAGSHPLPMMPSQHVAASQT